MPFDYSDDADEAAELVNENGRLVTFQKFSVTPPDLTKPWRGPVDPDAVPLAEHQNVAVVQASPSEPALGGLRMRNSELCKDMEAIFIVAPGSGITDDLLEFDVIVDGSTRWVILDGDKLQPGEGPVVLYYVGVKK
jgi:hypothetical protein